MIAVADTGPINYLVLIEAIDVLPAFYRRVVLASSVVAELTHPPSRHVRNGRPEFAPRG